MRRTNAQARHTCRGAGSSYFVLVQVLWGVLLFVPGSQAYRIYIRGFPFVASLIALGRVHAIRRSG